jgi:enoyl-CoA hydratase/carnithine racemase
VGLENALDLLMTGRIIDAAEALRVGLVGRVVAHDALMPTVREYATHLATMCSPRAVSIIKRQVWDSLLTDLGPAVDVAIAEMMASFGTADFAEGVTSFLEKRPPQFTGR